MQVKIISSGSKGNAAVLKSNGVNLLIDAGGSCRRIEQALKSDGLCLSDLSGILISHEHSDHTAGLKTLCAKVRLPIYCSGPVAERLMLSACADGSRYVRFRGDFNVNGLDVSPFAVPHDSVTCHGFRVEGDSVYVSSTDMGHYTDEIIEHLSGADISLIESNHDIDMLYSGPYPYHLKKRILSKNGHLSNTDCAELLTLLPHKHGDIYVLGHISSTNNTPSAAYNTIMSRPENRGLKVLCASETAPLNVAVNES